VGRDPQKNVPILLEEKSGALKIRKAEKIFFAWHVSGGKVVQSSSGCSLKYVRILAKGYHQFSKSLPKLSHAFG
jgi:hypothetical protein